MSTPYSTSPPPTKRKRCEDGAVESSVDKNMSRSDEFWFDDGSIVLQVENTQFRVHRTILAAKSDFFRDMFMLPQPEDLPMVEGCPLIVCMQDSVKDWTNVLMFIYHSTKLEQDGATFQFDFVASMLRLGKKYQMEVILRAGMSQVEKTVPAHNRRSTEWWSQVYFDNVSTLFAHINLAQELGIQTILPMCYFLCISICTMEQLIDGFMPPLRDDSPVLNAATRKLLLMARDRVLSTHRMCMLMWVLKRYRDTTGDCQSEDCRKIANNVITFCGERSIYSPTIHPPGKFFEFWLQDLCKQCANNAQVKRNEGMDDFWKGLPCYFNLPKWEDLKDFAD